MSDSQKCTKTHMGFITFLAPEFPLTDDFVGLFEKEIEACLSQGDLKISVGFKNVPYIDSAGLEALIDAQERLGQKGGELKIIHPNSICKEILIATRLNERFGV